MNIRSDTRASARSAFVVLILGLLTERCREDDAAEMTRRPHPILTDHIRC